MFYFDENIKKYENMLDFARVLQYLDFLYKAKPSTQLLNALITYSWFYLIEGPLITKKYEKEDTSLSLYIWSEYTNLVVKKNDCDSSTLYFCGYTLSLHGFLIEPSLVKLGHEMVRESFTRCTNSKLKLLISVFLQYDSQKKYKHIAVPKTILTSLFNNESLVGKYFIELNC